MKTKIEIFHTAIDELVMCVGDAQEESVLNGIWRTAFNRGHEKGMKDEQDILMDEADKTRRDFEKAQL